MANLTITGIDSTKQILVLVDGTSYILQNTGGANLYITERLSTAGRPPGGGNIVPPYGTWSFTKAANQEIWVWTQPDQETTIEVNG